MRLFRLIDDGTSGEGRIFSLSSVVKEIHQVHVYFMENADITFKNVKIVVSKEGFFKTAILHLFEIEHRDKLMPRNVRVILINAAELVRYFSYLIVKVRMSFLEA